MSKYAIVDLEISGTIKKVVHEDQDALAITKYYSMEDYIARKLMNLTAGEVVQKLGDENDIAQYEKLNNITLHENQKQAT